MKTVVELARAMSLPWGCATNASALSRCHDCLCATAPPPCPKSPLMTAADSSALWRRHNATEQPLLQATADVRGWKRARLATGLNAEKAPMQGNEPMNALDIENSRCYYGVGSFFASRRCTVDLLCRVSYFVPHGDGGLWAAVESRNFSKAELAAAPLGASRSRRRWPSGSKRVRAMVAGKTIKSLKPPCTVALSE